MASRLDELAGLDDYPVPAGEPPLKTEISQPLEPPRGRWGLILLGVGLILIALNLRMGVASIGPVLKDIRLSLSVSATTASLLTTIPVFVFGAFAFVTPSLTRRIGMHRLLGLTLLILSAGILLRLHPSLLALFAGTLCVGAAIAVGNVVMPAAIKQDFARHSGLMMGLYSTALFIGASTAAGFTAPLVTVVSGSWRVALALWAIPALLALLIWAPQVRRSPGRLKTSHDVADAPGEHGEPPFRSILTDPIAIAVTLLMGLQSLSYYTTLTWVPAIFQDDGLDATTAGWLLAYTAFPGIISSLLAPTIAAKLRRTWIPVVASGAAVAIAYAGLASFASSGAYIWMTFLGLGQGATIALSLTYIVWRSPDTHHTGHLSTMSQGFGYLIAGLGPIGIGAVHGLTGGWAIPLAVLGVLLMCQIIAGIFAARPKQIRARTSYTRLRQVVSEL